MARSPSRHRKRSQSRKKRSRERERDRSRSHGRRDRHRASSHDKDRRHDRRRSPSFGNSRKEDKKSSGHRKQSPRPPSPPRSPPMAPQAIGKVSEVSNVTRTLEIRNVPPHVTCQEINSLLHTLSGEAPSAVRLNRDQSVIATFQKLEHAQTLHRVAPNFLHLPSVDEPLEYRFQPDERVNTTHVTSSSSNTQKYEWICEICWAFNHSYRAECSRCKENRPKQFRMVDQIVAPNEPSTNELIVRGLEGTVTELVLKNFIALLLPACQNFTVKVPRDRYTQLSLDYGLVTFPSPREAEYARNELQRTNQIQGNTVRWSFVRRYGASTPSPKTPTSATADVFELLQLKKEEVKETKSSDEEITAVLIQYRDNWLTIREDQRQFYRNNHARYLPGSSVPSPLTPEERMMAELEAFTKSLDESDDTGEDSNASIVTPAVIEVVVETKKMSPIPVPTPVIPATHQSAPAAQPVSALAGAQRMKQMLEEQKRRLSAQANAQSQTLSAESVAAARLVAGVVTVKPKAKFTEEDDD